GPSGVLKNALDYLYAEWNNKAVGFVSYGAAGGVRAVEHLRLVAGGLQMADVRQQVALSLLTDFENFSVLRAGEYSLAALNTMLDQLVAWTNALAALRQFRAEGAGLAGPLGIARFLSVHCPRRPSRSGLQAWACRGLEPSSATKSAQP